MKNFKSALFGLFLLVSTKSFGCDCAGNVSLEEMQKWSYEHVDLIFVGDVVNVDIALGTYEMNVIEIFKGKYKQKTIKGKYMTSCSGIPDKGRWIIYANFTEDGMIDFSICGLSRSFHEPHFSSPKEYTIPPPESEEWKKAKEDPEFSIQQYIDFEREIIKLREEALSDLEEEINGLRKRRD